MTSDKEIHIGFVLFDPRYSFFWSLTSTCIQTEANQRNIRLDMRPANSVAQQVSEMEDLLAQRVDALLVKPMAMMNDSLLASVVRTATAVGVPVIALDSTIAEESLTSTIGSDNTKGQALVAEHIFRQLGGVGEVAYFQGDLRIRSGALRTQGFHDVLQRYPDIELGYEGMLDWRECSSRREEGARHAKRALAKHVDLRAIIASTDEGALGAADVIAEAGLSDHIMIAGFDGIPEALLAIFGGKMTATSRQAPRAIAREAVEAILQALKGEKVASNILTEVDLITYENVREASIESLQMVPGMVRNLIR